MMNKSVIKDDMEQVLQIEQACSSDNHEVIMSLINSAGSFDLKKELFLKIIESYENRSLFPVAYLLLFIKWLTQNNDYKTAMEYINQCRETGVAEERLSEIIFENVIKPEEAFYRAKFHENIQLLQKQNILFSKQEFDFDQIKKQVFIIENLQPDIPDNSLKKFDKEKRPLLIDIINIRFINNLLNENYIYLVYNDLHLFYYMLLFEDLSGIGQYIKQKRLIFFVGKEENLLVDFFLNLSTIPPDFCFGLSLNEKYTEIIRKIVRKRLGKLQSNLIELDDLYKDYDCRYYRELFAKGPSDIKIMLITSEKTEINQFIARNWFEAFLGLEYQAKLLIENEPYEHISNYDVYDSMNEFKPDIVFHINFTSNDIFKDECETRKNILWITRYRDSAGASLRDAAPGYEYNNTFVLPIYYKWEEQLKRIGFPENRILTTSDGVNTNVFKSKEKVNNQHVCDIVSVNNAVGSLSFRLDFYLGNIKNEIVHEAISEVVDELKGKIDDEKIIFIRPDYNSILDMMKEKLLTHGLYLNDEFHKSLMNLFDHIYDSLCRGRIMEWIIDSGITSNIKLWGKGWSNIKKFRKNHMGVARHGDELSSIYRSSKISISDNPWPVHERNFEVFASGGFPLIRYSKWPEIEKLHKITNYFRENEEVVLFYSKDDLLDKIQYYLDNPDERERVAENGRQIVIDHFSHIAIAGKTMDFIKNYYMNN